MTQISIIIEDDQGKQLAKVQSRKIKLKSYRLNEIEIAVENFRKEMLPKLTRALVEKYKNHLHHKKLG